MIFSFNRTFALILNYSIFTFLIIIMSTNYYKEIIENYKKLYETKKGYDTKVYAGEKPNIKEFHVHSFILKIHSKFFKTAFTEDVQKKDGYYILNSNYSP